MTSPPCVEALRNACSDCLPASYECTGARKNGSEPMNHETDSPTRRQDQATWSRSRWSRLGWGCHRHDVLPCMPVTCPYRERTGCGDVAPGNGRPCPFETFEARSLAVAYDREFGRARGVLGDSIYLDLVREMVICQLRLDRISMRDNWLDLNRAEALKDPGWFASENERLHRYHVTALNKWTAVRDRLREAAADPYAGWIDLFRVQYVLHGVGPACDIASHEVSLDNTGVWDYADPAEPGASISRWPYSDDPYWRFKW